MPKEATIKLYRYSELEGITGRTIGRNVPQDAAKHNVGDHWWQQQHEDERHFAEELFGEKGVTFRMEGQELMIDTSCCQGSGMSIKGNWDLSDFDECEAILEIATDYPQFPRESITVSVTQNDSHYVHSNTMDVECEFVGDTITVELEQVDPSEFEYGGPEQLQIMDEPLRLMADRILDVLRSFCDEIHRKLVDFVLSDSDGYINTWMDEMGYWFDEDGQIIERSED